MNPLKTATHVSSTKKKSTLIVLSLVFCYLFTHLFGLLELPVFADEAIYIRWSQLILDDWSRYLFFPMNDGKTPLFFWILAPFQLLFEDQLYAARFVSVIIGLIQMLVLMKIVSLLTKNKLTVYLSGILVMVLPFWYFHHRMALTDGLMTLLVCVSMFFLIAEFVRKSSLEKLGYAQIFKSFFQRKTVWNIVLAGIFFGLSIYTKIPAILFIPSLFLLIFLVPQRSFKALLFASLKVLGVISIGLFLFALLRFVPTFPQLFGRGGDFLFPLNEVLSGRWRETIPSLPVYFGYFISYMSPTLLLLIVIGLFSKKNKAVIHIFFWSGVLFVLPIGVMGKVVYARYLFPAVIPFTLAGVFAIEELLLWSKNFKTNLVLRFFFIGFPVLLLSNTLATSGVFMVSAMTNHAQIPFVSSDRVQYLTEWSSGHGLYETAQLIKQESKDTTLAVATEGSFGTLPDGLNLYFHRRDVSNIAIDGVGYPFTGISQKFAQTARNFDQKWLVVNSHRMNLDIDKKYLLREYCRPFDAPCLQIWNVTDVFEDIVLD